MNLTIRPRHFVIASLLLAFGWTAGYFGASRAAAQTPALARPVTIGLTATDPLWTFDPTEIERQVATFAKNNSITGQAAWTTFINGLTAGQSIAVSQGLLRAVKSSVP